MTYKQYGIIDAEQKECVMLDKHLRAEMIFYATTDDYSDADRYERFAKNCHLDKKGAEIGLVVLGLLSQIRQAAYPLQILETASATGLTAAGVVSELTRNWISHEYTSLDIEKNLLDYAKNYGRGHNFSLGDFEQLPFEDFSFDVYIMMGAEGYRSKGTFYSEVHRVLRPGGFFIMPQIGPNPVVSDVEKQNAILAGLIVVREDDYLIAKKP